MKVRTSVLIEKEILKKAQELGLNVSQFTENALRIGIQALTDSLQKIAQNQTVSSEKGGFGTVGSEKRWTGRDLNPRPPECKAKPTVSALPLAIDWEDFRNWLLQSHTSHVVNYMISYAKRFAYCLESGNLNDLLKLSPAKRRCVMSSLSNLAKYLGEYEAWKSLIRQYSLKWADKPKDLIIIERISKTKDPNEVFNWIRQVINARPDLTEFMLLMTYSGMRLGEAVSSYNLIIELSKQGRLSEYYSEVNETLEHFKFKERFLRKSKKCFVSVIPKELIQRIANRKQLNKNGIKTMVKRLGLTERFSDIREVHNTIMSKYLSEAELNFLAGRVAGVFLTNYFNPKWITDFKERVFKGIAEIKTRIENL